MTRLALIIAVLVALLAATAALAIYFFNALSPAMAVAGIAAVLSVFAFAIAAIALVRQQSVVEEQTSLAVLLDKSLVRMGRRLEEQEVKFAAARALAARPGAQSVEPVPEPELAEAEPKKERVQLKPPRTAMEIASESGQPAKRQRHKARFMPPPAEVTVNDAVPKPAEAPVYGDHFDIMLEPIVAIPAGTIAGYRVLAGFPQADGKTATIANAPNGSWNERGSQFGEMLFSKAAAIAQRHFAGADDARLYVSVPQEMFANDTAIKALKQRYADAPALSRALVPVIAAESLSGQGAAALAKSTRLREAGASVALSLAEETGQAAELAGEIGAVAMFAPVEVFPVASQPGWLDAVQNRTDAIVVATGIRAENSVISMMDRNVGYMTGPLFAEPKRLKDDEAAFPQR